MYIHFILAIISPVMVQKLYDQVWLHILFCDFDSLFLTILSS